MVVSEVWEQPVPELWRTQEGVRARQILRKLGSALKRQARELRFQVLL